jgi:hypothetical protein
MCFIWRRVYTSNVTYRVAILALRSFKIMFTAYFIMRYLSLLSLPNLMLLITLPCPAFKLQTEFVEITSKKPGFLHQILQI